MGHSQAEKLVTHQKIVEIAAQRFRELGVDGISVADIMKEANLTVGGFYKHFESRDELVAEALAYALTHLDSWELTAKTNLRKAIRVYLAEDHRDDPGSGCALAALVNDVSKCSEATREVYTDGVRRIFDIAEKALSPQITEKRRRKAMMLISASIGALALSRSVSDKKLSQQILDTVADELISLFAPTRISALA